MKSNIQANDVYAKEFPELVERIEKLPINERFDKSKLKAIRDAFIVEKLPEIIERAKPKPIIPGEPLDPSAGIESHSQDNPRNRQPILTKEERAAIKARGSGDPDAVETYLQEKAQGKIKKTGFAAYAAD